jgi:hypothetical protein
MVPVSLQVLNFLMGPWVENVRLMALNALALRNFTIKL